MKKNIEPEAILTPIPVVMVSCGEGDNCNITTVAWTGVISSNPPTIYISLRKSRYSYKIIKKSNEFVVNILDERLVKEADFCGIKSGNEIDKFKETNLTKEKGKIVKAPIIKECPVNIECIVKEIKEMGSHDMIIGEIVAINADEKVLNSNGSINLAKINAIAYMGPEYYVANTKIANRGIALNNN